MVDNNRETHTEREREREREREAVGRINTYHVGYRYIRHGHRYLERVGWMYG